MISFFDRASLEHALTLPLPSHLRELLHRRINQIIDDGLADLTHLLVIEAGDIEAMVRKEIGLSPLEFEGVRYGSPGFTPRWDWIHDYGPAYEMIYCIGNDGFAFLLLIIKADEASPFESLCQQELNSRAE